MSHAALGARGEGRRSHDSLTQEGRVFVHYQLDGQLLREFPRFQLGQVCGGDGLGIGSTSGSRRTNVLLVKSTCLYRHVAQNAVFN
jgi:hypothetical protein